jgi:hypothetical protein
MFMNDKSSHGMTARMEASVVRPRLEKMLTIAVVVFFLNPTHVRGSDVAPFGELSGDLSVPTNATIYEAPGPLPFPFTPAQSASPLPTNSFLAACRT